MARIHHIDGWMRKYKELDNQKNILETDNRIQFLRTVADTDQSKIDIINEYMQRVEELGHFYTVSPNDKTLAKYTTELKAIQENYARDEKKKEANTLQRIAYAKWRDKQNETKSST